MVWQGAHFQSKKALESPPGCRAGALSWSGLYGQNPFATSGVYNTKREYIFMQNRPRPIYPKVQPGGVTHQLTVCGDLYHSNVISTKHRKDAVRKADEIYSSQEDDARALGAIMMLLSDVPEEPLLTANKAQVGSVLGLCALGFMINHKQFGPRARRIAESGEGQMILRLSGGIANPQCEIQLFDTQEEYAAFLQPILASGNFATQKNSTLL